MSDMSQGGMAAWGRGRGVSFYALDNEGVTAVARYVADGWDHDECVVSICTTDLRRRVEGALARLGCDPAAEVASARYWPRDPEASIAGFVLDGRFDVDAFWRMARTLVGPEVSGGRRVRVFSETLSLLWQRGLVEAAIELELHWAEAMDAYGFQLVCAYPGRIVDHAELVDVARITALHVDLHVDPAARAGASGEPGAPRVTPQLGLTHAYSQVYQPLPESVPAARHFVLDVLRSWGHDGLTTDAALIVSELATNALSHAVTPFRALVERRDGGVRIGVEDATDAPLERRERSADAVDGRGVEIVEALSGTWGAQSLPGGKVVWADLDLSD
ncbi:MEDS domain-containing protein [Intrasporangium flavum]|uniref:MEDS domain-containing protein n=1 Tax=Intrasporangium flavum TaxID=1428657 RepID=UPI001A96D4A4|nr:MEDS domain-containing protein [Intrasporangium flavum]